LPLRRWHPPARTHTRRPLTAARNLIATPGLP
jgi:hypothetical protein